VPFCADPAAGPELCAAASASNSVDTDSVISGPYGARQLAGADLRDMRAVCPQSWNRSKPVTLHPSSYRARAPHNGEGITGTEQIAACAIVLSPRSAVFDEVFRARGQNVGRCCGFGPRSSR